MTKIAGWKIATRLGVLTLMLCAAAGSGSANPHGYSGHSSGGTHVSHFSSGGPHISHFSSGPHISHYGRPSYFTHAPRTYLARPYYSHGHRTARFTHVKPSSVHPLTFTSHRLNTHPRNFAYRRRFATNAALRPFWHHGWWHHGWHPYYHLGWIGPLFWPYAYGDFFYCSMWPGDYCGYDPLWVYGYGDIYQGLFSPYDYEDYVRGPGAPARMAALTENMAQSCQDEAAEVTGWPIDQIRDVLQPNPQQSALLDDLGNAIVKASDEIKTNCPANVAFTPTARLDQMHQRLQTLVDTVAIVTSPLMKFYDSLSDEQKARFNDIAPPASRRARTRKAQQGEPSLQDQCNAKVMAWPSDQFDRALQPNAAQRAKLEALHAALDQAADTIKAACPSDIPTTPPSRLEAFGTRLQAMLKGVETVQPALADFYNALDDEQKARFNAMGRQLFTENRE